MYFAIGFIIGSSVSLFIGWYAREVVLSLRAIRKHLAPKPDPSVTNPYIRPRPDNSQDVIIQPKSPQQLQMEAYEKLKRGELN